MPRFTPCSVLDDLSKMAGRYVAPDLADAERNLRMHRLEYGRCFNLAPRRRVPLVRSSQGETGRAEALGSGALFARGVPPRNAMINAPVETRLSGGCRRNNPDGAQRCVVIASGFYEWRVLDEGRKPPF